MSQTNNAIIKEMWGDKLYTNLLECKGTITCLVKSLKASNKGWTKPINETLLGPTRLWKSPITFRSKRVKKATDNKINNLCTTQETRKNIFKVCLWGGTVSFED